MTLMVPVEEEEEFVRAIVLERDGLDYLLLQIYLKEADSWKLASINVVDYVPWIDYMRTVFQNA